MNKISLESLETRLKAAVLEAGEYSQQIASTLRLCFTGHTGQFREAADSQSVKIPYIVHPVGVAILVAEHFHSLKLPDSLNDVICAALAHDLLEDTPITVQELVLSSSRRTCDLVLALTKPNAGLFNSRDKRAEAFGLQIANAGVSACAIKLCDVMHNLGRPATSPLKLLQKSIRKAETDYIAVKSALAHHPAILNNFNQAVSAAKANVLMRDEPLVTPHAKSLLTALTYISRRVKAKPLEAHDFQALMQDALGAVSVFRGTLETFLDSGLLGEVVTRIPKSAVNDMKQAIARGSGLIAVELSVKTHIFVFKARFNQNDFSAKQNIFIIFRDLHNSWISLEAIESIVTWLDAEVQLVRQDISLRFASECSRLRLFSSPEKAENIGVSLSDLSEIHTALNQAIRVESQAVDVVNHILSLETPGLAAYASLVDRIESRTKTPDSILAKLIERKISDWKMIDDIVGMRIVVPSKAVVQGVIENLLQYFEDDVLTSTHGLEINKKTITCKRSESHLGYSSAHVYFLAKLSLGFRSVWVSSELQIRTIQEDAWARISYQSHLYKTSKSSDALVSLAELRDQSEKLIDTLSFENPIQHRK